MQYSAGKFHLISAKSQIVLSTDPGICKFQLYDEFCNWLIGYNEMHDQSFFLFLIYSS